MENVKRLKPHPIYQNVYGDPRLHSAYQGLVKSIKSRGVLEPILITHDRIVINGHKRLAVAMQLNLENVPVHKIESSNELDRYELLITLNVNRKRQPSVMVREALVLASLENWNGKSSLHEDITEGLNGHPPPVSSATATNVGFARKREFDKAQAVLQSSNSDLIELMDSKTITSAYRRLHNSGGRRQKYSSIIKPSDNWNFSQVYYPRIDGHEKHGYIPGDLYANCFWYFVKPGDVVVDPMAGSGMAHYVYERRDEWMGDHKYDFDLAMFDLTPQNSNIVQHDLRLSFPVKKADYIFLDLPYFGMSQKVYSEKSEDLANMGEGKYMNALSSIAGSCSSAQKRGKLCTVVSPNFTDLKNRKVSNISQCIKDAWYRAGYVLHVETYSSRRIQQEQSIGMAKLNNLAKQQKLPLTDISIVMTFRKV